MIAPLAAVNHRSESQGKVMRDSRRKKLYFKPPWECVKALILFFPTCNILHSDFKYTYAVKQAMWISTINLSVRTQIVCSSAAVVYICQLCFESSLFMHRNSLAVRVVKISYLIQNRPWQWHHDINQVMHSMERCWGGRCLQSNWQAKAT